MKSVIFKIDKELDIDIGDSFIDDKIEDLDFGQERIIDIHPDLSIWKGKPGSERKKAIQEYVSNIYESQNQELISSLELAQSIWEKVEKPFFKEMEKIFGSLDFYKHDKIVGKTSIFAAAVIEDDGRSFQFFYKQNF